ncbi:hypothetical protein V8D89_002429 [Ganoderma adspersum]
MESATSLALCGLLAVLTALVIRWRRDPINAIPTLGGPSLPLLSYRGAFNFISHSNEILQEGYARYYNSVFKVAMLDQWFVIVNGVSMVEDIRSKPENELSTREGAGEFIRTAHTLGPIYHHDPYHTMLIQDRLTRHIPKIMDDCADEAGLAMQELIPPKEDWIGVTLDHRLHRVMARISNRAFVGLPACHNEEYLQLVVHFTGDIVKDRTTGAVNFVPDFLMPYVRKRLSYAAHTISKATVLLKPVIDKRRALLQKVQDSEDRLERPNDMLQWVMDEAASRTGTDEEIATRVMLINFASIHTVALAFNHAILHLADEPELVQAMREETEKIVDSEGWTKASLAKMTKLDAFLRESQRLNGSNLLAMLRKAMVDVTLRDGTLIPAGTIVATSQYAIHHDPQHYDRPDAFDPSRWETADADGARKTFVTTSDDYIPWGNGKYSCPGRFFAAVELKITLAYLVMNYDMMFEGGGRRPPNEFWATTVHAAPNTTVLFKARPRLLNALRG